MPPDKPRGGPASLQAAPLRASTSDGTTEPATSIRGTTDKRRLIPIVVAVCYAPSGRRRRWIGVVEQCPACELTHVHYGTTYGPPHGLRLAGCARGLYRLHAIYGGRPHE